MAGFWWTLGAAALSLSSCATSGSFDADMGSSVHYSIRAIRAENDERIVEAIPAATGSPATLEPWMAEFIALPSPLSGFDDDAGATETAEGVEPAVDHRAFNPSLLPGPRLSVDFEMGVRCDEGDEDLHHSDVHDLSGMSETLLRVSCSYGLTHIATLVGTAAASQILDETLEGTIADSELIWFAVGVRFSF
jgi:hypothetical protein